MKKLMKTLTQTLACLTLVAACWSCAPTGEQIILCGDDQVRIIDTERSTADSLCVVWQWQVADADSLLPNDYATLLQTLDECKTYDGGRQILLCSSGGAALLLDRATGRTLWHARVPMAHSAELLPGGRVAVALSTHPRGNSIELYDLNRPNQTIYRDSLYSGHGVVWMERSQRLYALGFDQLRAYSLQFWHTDTPCLRLEQQWTIPVESGHDLVRISPQHLIVTGHEGAYVFDTHTAVFTPFAPLAECPNVKSVNFVPVTGRLVYTKAEESWWTHHVYAQEPEQVFTFPHIKVYKARIVE